MNWQSPVAEPFTIYSLCEYAVTLEFNKGITEQTLDDIVAFHTLLNQQPFDGFETAVPAYATLSVFFDPVQVMQSIHLQGTNCFQRVSAYLQTLRQAVVRDKVRKDQEPPVVTIPVCYGGEFGPDLEEVAHRSGLSPNEVIQQHSSAMYRVYLIGFTPGFPYLGGLPASLATPRKQTPRASVPRGSIGIAGQQTGIYPQNTPGGWQIIGRTAQSLFDVKNRPPALLKVGDHVIFRPITPDQFNTND